MEAPEKLYVAITHPLSDKYTEMIAFEHGVGIEYTRTDAFIEKACKFIKERLFFEDSWHVSGEDCILDKVIWDFKSYMKEE